MTRPDLTHKPHRGTWQERQAESAARAWKYDAQLEKLAALRDADSPRYGQMPATMRTSLGYYLEQKAAATALGVDTSRPSGDAA